MHTQATTMISRGHHDGAGPELGRGIGAIAACCFRAARQFGLSATMFCRYREAVDQRRSEGA
jgi:hypothetical protein